MLSQTRRFLLLAAFASLTCTEAFAHVTPTRSIEHKSISHFVTDPFHLTSMLAVAIVTGIGIRALLRFNRQKTDISLTQMQDVTGAQ